MLTVLQAAEQVGRDPETVRRWIRSGKLPAKKVGRRYFVNEVEIESLSDESDMLPLPVEWKFMDDGTPQPDWVKLVRRVRQAHSACSSSMSTS